MLCIITAAPATSKIMLITIEPAMLDRFPRFLRARASSSRIKSRYS